MGRNSVGVKFKRIGENWCFKEIQRRNVLKALNLTGLLELQEGAFEIGV